MDNRLIVDQSPKDVTQRLLRSTAPCSSKPTASIRRRISRPGSSGDDQAGGRSAYMFTGSAPGCESDDEKAQAIAREIALERAGRQGLTPKRWEEAVAKLINKQKNEQMNC
ncbi:hypothetical protein GPALN_014439 [Globodera pallida]|nr:hypothetical protein GPALN_014439 [Globodera pallida]